MPVCFVLCAASKPLETEEVPDPPGFFATVGAMGAGGEYIPCPIRKNIFGRTKKFLNAVYKLIIKVKFVVFIVSARKESYRDVLHEGLGMYIQPVSQKHMFSAAR